MQFFKPICTYVLLANISVKLSWGILTSGQWTCKYVQLELLKITELV